MSHSLVLSLLSLSLVAGCGDRLALSCPEGTRTTGGSAPEGAAAWWTLSASPDEVEGLAEAWPFPAWGAMGANDRARWCAAPGEPPSGPTLQIRAPREAGHGGLVQGAFDDLGRPDGEWTATWRTEDRSGEDVLAFQGAYDHGLRSGVWSFRDVQGVEVARGAFERGRPHGMWTIRKPGSRLEVRYIYGTLHGTWHETFEDGREIRGHYFDGTRNYEWEFLAPDPVTQKPSLVSEEAWKYDTFVARWVPGRDADPRPGLDLPFTPIGPEGEGMCEVHARCASNAYLTVMLTGAAADPDALWLNPVLVDYSDPNARPADASRVYLVDDYSLGEVRTDDAGTSGEAEILLPTLCIAGGPEDPVVPHRETIRRTLQWRWEHDVWRVVEPLPEVYVRFDAFFAKARERDPAWAERVRTVCRGR
ncbi:MAG: hypothetical protein JXB39_12875 [Deltaproteobacteria bacterium]|nr:hypothetical protein [Deltaproteobacteria bacterium]